MLTPSGPSAEPTFKTRCVLSIFVKNFFDGRLAVSAERVAGVTFLKIFNKNGRLTRDGGLSPLRSDGVTFLKMRPKNGRFTRGPRSFSAPMFVLFWGGLHGDSVLFPLRCLFSKICLWAVYTGTPVFFSTPPLVLFLGGGVRFFSAFNAVLFCTFVVGRAGRACLGLPSVGFVNAV